uniref:Dynactin subunit 1 n=1 Tax=Hadrurus spadix TaxID=141984 RepID=A0A1W7RAM6_9SCOR
MPLPTSNSQRSTVEFDSVKPTVVSAMGAAANNIDNKLALLQKDQEIENLKTEIKDLKEKLETIMLKRSEDKVKLKEFEKTKIQLQQLLEFKSKISESQADLQRQLAIARKEAKEAVEQQQQHADEMADLAEAAEIATLDKEMAEEKCETLQAEIEQMKEKIEELTLDLEIIRSEISEKGSEGAAAHYEVKQLEQQNERLKEALMKLRDLSAHEKQEQQRMQKELDHQKSEITELSRTKEKLSMLVEDYEKQLNELKEQVDAALGAEEMVELLTDRNLTLEEKVRELQESVDDLERLHDVNEQLQESARENEIELREEIDMTKAKVSEANRKMEAMQETLTDYEQTIHKFRELTEHLRENNNELRAQLEKESDKVAKFTPAETFDYKVKFAETKAFARAVEMEMRRMEVQQANQHVSYLCSFMPDSFLARGGDHDAILVLLLVPRIISKAEILSTQVRDKFQLSEEIKPDAIVKSHKLEQYSFACCLLVHLYTLQSFLHQYMSALRTCSVELFMKIGTLYPEMAVQERALDFYIDLLRRDQLDENVQLETLQKAVAYFQSLYSVHLANEQVDYVSLMSDFMQLFGAACDGINTDIGAISVLIKPGEHETDIGNLLKDTISCIQNIRPLVKKIRRRLPNENSSITIKFGQEIQNQLVACREHMERVITAAHIICQAAMQQVIMSPEVQYISTQKLKELAHKATDEAYGKDDIGPGCLTQSLNLVLELLAKISNALQDGEYDSEVFNENKVIAPVFMRAQCIKGETKDVENLKFKLEAREMDIIEIKKALKLKSEELSEMHIRKEMTERKLELSSRDNDEQIERIQRQLDETKMMLKKKEKEFEDTLDHLQADIDALETERGELKDKLKAISKKALIEGLSKPSSFASLVQSPTSPTLQSTTSSSPIVRDSPLLIQLIQDLKLALKHVKNENIRLKTDTLKDQLAKLPPLKLPSKQTGIASPTGFSNMLDLESGSDTKLAHVAKRTSHLLKELNDLSASPTLVDISKRRAATQPSIQKIAPVNHLLESLSTLRKFQKEVDQLQFEVTSLAAARHGNVHGEFATFPDPHATKALKDKEQLVAKVLFPPQHSSKVTSSETISLLVNINELKNIHSKLL